MLSDPRNKRTTIKTQDDYLSRYDRYYVFTRLLSSVSRFVIILWIFNGFGCPWGWNPFEHKRGNADGEFQNNMILSQRLSGPNKIYLNINSHRGVHYLEVSSKYRRNIGFVYKSSRNEQTFQRVEPVCDYLLCLSKSLFKGTCVRFHDNKRTTPTL